MVDEACQEESKGKVTYSPSSQGERADTVREFVRGGATPAERLGRFIAVAAANSFASERAVAESSRFSREVCLSATATLYEVIDGMPAMLETAYLKDTERPEFELKARRRRVSSTLPLSLQILAMLRRRIPGIAGTSAG